MKIYRRMLHILLPIILLMLLMPAFVGCTCGVGGPPPVCYQYIENAKDEAYAKGLKEGEDKGYDKGYREGYDKGRAEGESNPDCSQACTKCNCQPDCNTCCSICNCRTDGGDYWRGYQDGCSACRGGGGGGDCCRKCKSRPEWCSPDCCFELCQ